MKSKKTKEDEREERLSILESDILSVLCDEPFVNQRILAETSGHSLGVVNRSLRSLIASGYLDEQVQLTPKAVRMFKARAPRNAIILAAGFGMRMVPINLTTPKAFLEVNGEKLIERTIRQLKEAGVQDITVVVGFMKDSFEYLIDEYGVDLVYNPEFASANNIRSLGLVLSKLSNTYIIPCDIWCDRNPFRRNELYSWYMVSDLIDEESTVRVNRKMELVTVSEDEPGNGMIGISYLLDDDAAVVRARMEKLLSAGKHDEAFWETALYDRDRMFVRARVVHSTDAVEINTYEQLRELDSHSNQLKSDAIQTIAEALDCGEQDVREITVLKKGMTNRSFLFSVNGTKYIMRIPGEGTDQLINRSVNLYCLPAKLLRIVIGVDQIYQIADGEFLKQKAFVRHLDIPDLLHSRVILITQEVQHLPDSHFPLDFVAPHTLNGAPGRSKREMIIVRLGCDQFQAVV